MLTNSTEQMPIAVRLYDNKKYGKPYGKGVYHKAVFNGIIDNQDRSVSYLVDFFNHDDWVNQAQTDAQMEILAEIQPQADTLYSWIKHYERPSNQKTLVPGVAVFDLTSSKIAIGVQDPARGIDDVWHLTAKPCKIRDDGTGPQLLATNADLGSW